jgi:hypothetical protein
VDGIPVATQIAAEAPQFRWTPSLYGSNPLLELVAAPFTNETEELLCKLTRGGQLTAPFAQLIQQ